MSKPAPIVAFADKVAQVQDTDVLLINGPIYRPFDEQVIDLCRKRRRRKNVLLILVTEGGDADAAFRIARFLQERYERFSVYVTGYCKSAGTLIALGACELVITDVGELGPLDVQMSKPDELIQTQSGLTATAALATLHSQAFQAFEHFFLQTVMRSGNGISTRSATQIAVQLACGLFSPIYAHVDPMHVGEAGRALLIAEKYGQLLQAASKNFGPDTLSRLTRDYPSHGFVIDRSEAETLFEHVREPNDDEQALADRLGANGRTAYSTPDQRLMAYLSSELPEAAIETRQGPNGSDNHEETPPEHEPTPSGERGRGENPTGDAGTPGEDHVPEGRQITTRARSRGDRPN